MADTVEAAEITAVVVETSEAAAEIMAVAVETLEAAVTDTAAEATSEAVAMDTAEVEETTEVATAVIASEAPMKNKTTINLANANLAAVEVAAILNNINIDQDTIMTRTAPTNIDLTILAEVVTDRTTSGVATDQTTTIMVVTSKTMAIVAAA